MKVTARIELPKKLTAKIKELKMPLSGGYEQGFEDGKEAGYVDGVKDGEVIGYEKGHADGYEDGSAVWSGFWKDALERIEIPEGTTAFPIYSIYNKTNLKELIFPTVCPSPSASSVFQCTALQRVLFKGKPKSINSRAFSGCNKLTVIDAPWSEGEVANAPWGATNATINYNYVEGSE